MASTKLPARLLDTSAVPELTVTGNLTVDTSTLKVDSSNNRIGVGTTSPLGPLHVVGDASATGISHTYVYDSTSLVVEAGEPSIQLRAADSGTHGGSLLWRYGNNVFSAIANPTDDTIDWVYGVSNANSFDVHGGTNLSSYKKIMTIGAAGNVGIGTTDTYNSEADNLIIYDSGNAGLTIATGSTSGNNTIHFADGTSGDAQYRGVLEYEHNDDSMRFKVAGEQEAMRIDASGNLKFNSGFGSVGTSYAVRAWVNFDGNYSSDAVIEEDGNVSSVVDNAVGDYTINFSSNMPDGHYAVSGFGTAYASTNVVAGCLVGLHSSGVGTYIPTTKTTSAVRVCFGFGNTAALSDIRDGSIIIVR